MQYNYGVDFNVFQMLASILMSTTSWQHQQYTILKLVKIIFYMSEHDELKWLYESKWYFFAAFKTEVKTTFSFFYCWLYYTN